MKLIHGVTGMSTSGCHMWLDFMKLIHGVTGMSMGGCHMWLDFMKLIHGVTGMSTDGCHMWLDFMKLIHGVTGMSMGGCHMWLDFMKLIHGSRECLWVGVICGDANLIKLMLLSFTLGMCTVLGRNVNTTLVLLIKKEFMSPQNHVA